MQEGSDFMSPTSSSRSARKDAQYNRAQILDAASRAFASQGVDASMDAIAKDAGVGAGTLYRHFPNKDALLAALLDAHYQTLETKRQLIASEDIEADQMLDRWIDALGDWMLVYDGLPEPLRAAWSEVRSPLSPTCRQVIETTDQFLNKAKREGRARQDLTGHEIFLAALAIAWASGASTADGSTRSALRNLLKLGWTTGKDQQRS